MLIHNDLFSVVLGAYSVISNLKKGAKVVSYKTRNSHTHYFCPRLSAVFIGTTLLGKTVPSKWKTALEAIKAGDQIKIKDFFFFFKHQILNACFQIIRVFFLKNCMHLCVSVYGCVFFKVNEYHHRWVCYYFITRSEYNSGYIPLIQVRTQSCGRGDVQEAEADGLERPLNVYSSWRLGGIRNWGYEAGIITMSTRFKSWWSLQKPFTCIIWTAVPFLPWSTPRQERKISKAACKAPEEPDAPLGVLKIAEAVLSLWKRAKRICWDRQNRSSGVCHLQFTE